MHNKDKENNICEKMNVEYWKIMSNFAAGKVIALYGQS
jgi:hypothetical protein